MAKRHFGEAHGASAAENYERFFVPAIGEPLASMLVERAAPGPGDRVLDVACGTGVVARLAWERVGPDGAVAGLDVNPGMLAVARSTAPDGAIDWHESSAESMPLPDGSFDLVLCQLSLQFFDDPAAALREMRRVLADGGRLALNVPGPAGPPMAILAEEMGRHIGPEAAGFVRHVFSLHDTDQIEGLLDEAEFRDVEVEASTGTLRLPPPREFLWQYVNSTPLGAVVAGADDDARAALERETVSRWREFSDDGAMEYRQRIVTASARK